MVECMSSDMDEHMLVSYWWSWMDSEIHNEGFKHHSSSVMAKDLLNCWLFPVNS